MNVLLREDPDPCDGFGGREAGEHRGAAVADFIHRLGDGQSSNGANLINTATAGSDTVVGGNGDDLIFSDAGLHSVGGRSGDDTIIGGSSADTLLGGVRWTFSACRSRRSWAAQRRRSTAVSMATRWTC